jgi:DNA polymerase-3 subunit beta
LQVAIDRSALASATAIAARAISTRTSLQVLTGIHLDAQSDHLRLTATDLELALSATAPATVAHAGSTVVPGRIFSEIVRSLSAPSVELALSDDTLSLTAGSARFSLRTLPSDDFPLLDTTPHSSPLSLPATLLTEDIPRVARAASRDETRPHLTGILLTATGDHLRLVATDSYRLALCELAAPTTTLDVNIPARSLQEVSRIAANSEAQSVSLAVDGNRALFSIDSVLLQSRLVEGRFPSYEQLVPAEWDHEVHVDRIELLDIVKRVSLVAQQHTPLKLTLSSGQLTLSAQAPDVGEATESLPVSYNGTGLTIGFNPVFLRDGLETALEDSVVLRFLSPLRPALIESTSSDNSKRFLYLVMPIRLDS